MSNDLGTFTDSETMELIRKIIKTDLDFTTMLASIMVLAYPQEAKTTLMLS